MDRESRSGLKVKEEILLSGGVEECKEVSFEAGEREVKPVLDFSAEQVKFVFEGGFFDHIFEEGFVV